MKLGCFLRLRFLLVGCLIGSAVPSLYCQTNQVLVEHDTVKAKRYFERGMALKDDLESDSVEFYFEEAGRLFELNGSWSQQLKSYVELREFFYKRKEPKKDLTFISLAIGIAENKFDGNRKQLGQLYRKKGGTLIRLGKYGLAETALKSALELLGEYDSLDNNIASCYYSLGWVFMLMNDFDLAFFYSEKALQAKKMLSLDLVNSYNLIAAIYYYKADYKSAKRNWEYALIESQKSSQKPEHSGQYQIDTSNFVMLKSLGAVEFQQGHYKKAYEYYLRVFRWEKSYYKVENHFLASSYFNLAEILDKRKKYDVAIQYLRGSLRIYGTALGSDSPEIIEVYEKLGNVYKNQGNYPKALEAYKEAYKLNENVNGIPEYSASLYGKLGEVYSDLEIADSSYYYFHLSQAILKNIYGSKHPKIAENHLKLALLEKSQSNWDQAMDECENALYSVVHRKDLDSLRSQDIRFTTKGIDVLSTYAKYLTDAFLENFGSIEDLEKALDFIDLAIELIQQKRILVFDQKAQHDFSERYAPVYEEGLRIALMLHKETRKDQFLEIAFQMMEGSRSFTLNQSTQNREEPIAYSLPDSLLEIERSLKVDISFYQEEILNRKANLDGYDTTLVRNYEDKLFYRKRDFDLLKQRLEQEYPKYHELKYQNRALSFSELQQRLSEEELLIEYLWHEDHVTVVGITKHRVRFEEIPVDQFLIDQLILISSVFNQPRSTLSVEEYAQVSNEVYQKLVAPALSISGPETTKLIVIPDGPLTRLNFDLLVQDQSNVDSEWKDLPYLIRDYAIATGYSATLFFDEDPRPQHSPNGLLAFSFGEKSEIRAGDHLTMEKVRSADLTSLPGSAKEIKSISELVQGDYYYGQQASEQTFKEVASDYRILHLALHGNVDEENPDFSKLHLYSRDTTEDGQLHVYELYNMELNADLAVLSACNTGSGKYQTGEGIMSMGHAFSYAGVNSLLLTRWDLSDEAAPEIMKVFYQELKDGKDKSEALRVAKMEYLENASLFRSNPFYWGSFFVLGDDSPIEFKKSNQSIYALIGGFVLILLILAFIRKRGFMNHTSQTKA